MSIKNISVIMVYELDICAHYSLLLSPPPLLCLPQTLPQFAVIIAISNSAPQKRRYVDESARQIYFHIFDISMCINICMYFSSYRKIAFVEKEQFCMKCTLISSSKSSLVYEYKKRISLQNIIFTNNFINTEIISRLT